VLVFYEEDGTLSMREEKRARTIHHKDGDSSSLTACEIEGVALPTDYPG
jgi:hypothetical protein